MGSESESETGWTPHTVTSHTPHTSTSTSTPTPTPTPTHSHSHSNDYHSVDSRSTKLTPGSSANALYRLRKFRYATFVTFRASREIRTSRPQPGTNIRSVSASRLKSV